MFQSPIIWLGAFPFARKTCFSPEEAGGSFGDSCIPSRRNTMHLFFPFIEGFSYSKISSDGHCNLLKSI